VTADPERCELLCLDLPKAEVLRSTLLPARQLDQLARAAKGLGDPTRLAIAIALVGFGADSLIEALAGLVVLWRFATSRVSSAVTERRAQQLIAASFYLIAAYIAVEATRTLATTNEPKASWVGIGLSAFTLATMPPLAAAKARVAEALGSPAAKSESRQTILCAYLSAGLLVGLGLNALAGWWWADPITALVIAGVAAKEGRGSWRDESCCTTPPLGAAEHATCDDDCCA
jgi:divalent metal cation (Fe/Co/Zn/Cd) transporter